MFQTNNNSAINSAIKKSYEIAYALFRISAKVSEKSFSEAITTEGIKLLRSSANAEYGETEKILLLIEYLMRLGSGVGIIDLANSETLIYELNELRNIIAELSKEGQITKVDKADISDIFTKSEIGNFSGNEFGNIKSNKLGNDNNEMASFRIAKDEKVIKNENPYFVENEYDPNDDISQPKKSFKEFGNNPLNNDFDINYNNSANEYKYNVLVKNKKNTEYKKVEIGDLLKSGNRQSAILERIRRSGNCRIKDLCQLLPDCSERTIRYDLQSLIEQDLIERVGVVGPAVYYKTKVV
jgi:hypothetical protein